MQAEEEPLTEAALVPDIFVSGLARIEDVGGGNLRFTFYALQKSVIYADQRRERVVVARIIMPASSVGGAAMAAQMAVKGVSGAIGDTVVEQRH